MRVGLIVIALALSVVIPFAIWGDKMGAWLDGDAAVATLRRLEPWSALAAVSLLVADIVLPLPASGVMAALGVLYGPLIGGLLAAAGNFLSGLVAYLACRRFGRPAARWFLGEDGYRRASAGLDGFGVAAVAGSRALPVLPEVTACLAGMLGMTWRRFLPALACGAAVTGFGFALLGHLGRDQPALVVVTAMVLPPLVMLAAGRRFRCLARSAGRSAWRRSR